MIKRDKNGRLIDTDRENGWRPLWADFNNKADNPPEGYKTEIMYSDYDGYPIKWRHVKIV